MRLTVVTVALALACSSCGGEGASDATSGADVTFPTDPYETATSDSGGLRFSIRTAPSQPPAPGASTIELLITDAAGAPRDGLVLDIVPWMPAMGHGTSVRPTVTPKSGGTYVVTNVNLFMPGEWELRTSVSGPLTDHVAPRLTVP